MKVTPLFGRMDPLTPRDTAGKGAATNAGGFSIKTRKSFKRVIPTKAGAQLSPSRQLGKKRQLDSRIRGNGESPR